MLDRIFLPFDGSTILNGTPMEIGFVLTEGVGGTRWIWAHVHVQFCFERMMRYLETLTGEVPLTNRP